jgi:glyoxylase-like metal-dependent hydrolase (beta-lactamase superfamily II)
MTNIPIRIPLPEVLNMQTVNSWLIKDPEPTLIDCGELTEDSWRSLNQQLKENGLTISDIQKIVITHAHVDHIGMANRITENSGAKVWLSEYAYQWGYDVQKLWTQRSNLIRNTFLSYLTKESPIGQLFGKTESFFSGILNMWEPIPEEATKQFIAEDGIYIGGERWEAIYAPGHSSTQTVFIHPESRHMFSADMLLKLAPTPVIEMDPDDPTKRQKGLPTLIQSFEKMKKLNIKKVYPGHYEAFENINTVINNQLERIEKRLAETHQLIAKGSNTYDDLFGIVYANRMSFPAAVMMIGYLDELEERELIKKEMTSQGIYTFITS